MSITRVVVDIASEDAVSDAMREKIATSLRHYADGVVPEILMDGKAQAKASTAHEHSVVDHACQTCREHAADGIS